MYYIVFPWSDKQADIYTQVHPYTQIALGLLTSAAQVRLLVGKDMHLTWLSGDHCASELRQLGLRSTFKDSKCLCVPSSRGYQGQPGYDEGYTGAHRSGSQ